MQFEVQERKSRTGKTREFYARRKGTQPWVRIKALQFTGLLGRGATLVPVEK